MKRPARSYTPTKGVRRATASAHEVECPKCGWAGEIIRLGAECPECDKPLYFQRAMR